MQLKIDPEFEALIPPLTQAESVALSDSLLTAGRANDAIVVWAQGNCVIDGHNRYRICTKLNLPFDTRSLSFPDRAAVKSWILSNQAARRNISPDQQIMLFALRGAEPPKYLPPTACAQAKEMAAAGAKQCEHVIAGKCPVRVAYGNWQRATGNAPAKAPRAKQQQHPPTIPVPPPPDDIDPLDVARISRAEKRHRDTDKRALEAALRKLDDTERTLDAFAACAAEPPPPITPITLDPAKRDCVAMFMLSDVHYGAIFPETASTFGNALNPAIIAYRIQRAFAAVAWKIKTHRHWANISHLVVAALGDNVEGQLHEETLETAQPSLQSLVEIYPIYLNALRYLAEELAPIEIIWEASWGNHGRDTHRVRHITGAKHSVDWVLAQMLAKTAPDGVQVHTSLAEDQYLKICGRPWHQQHGMSIGYQGGVGGLSIPLNKATAQWDKRTPQDFDLEIAVGSMVRQPDALHGIGHWHQSLKGTNWFVNGSIKGYDPYVSWKNATPDQPKQWFFLWDSMHGPTEMSELWVSNRKAELKLR